jgi:hypothetical protein
MIASLEKIFLKVDDRGAFIIIHFHPAFGGVPSLVGRG